MHYGRFRRLLGAALALALGTLATAQVPDFYAESAYRSIYLQFNQANYWAQLEANYVSEVEIPADMTVDGIVYPSVAVRFRGNTSYTWLPAGSQKKSFNIRTDVFVPGQDLYGYDHINLNNGFHDPTFLREFATYWVMRRHGPAPKCNFVKLYLNGQYWGVYINVQQPNKDWAKDWFRSNDGNRYRGFPTTGSFSNGRCALTWLGATVANYLAAYQAKQGDGTDLMQLCNVLNNTPSAQLQAALPAWFNVDQFYRYASVMNIMTQDDSYIGSGKDHFLYRDEAHGDFHMFPFDLNEALAGSTSMNPWLNTTATSKPAFSKTLIFPDWRERYDAHYRNILETSFSWSVLGPVLQQYHAMIAADVAADTKKIYSTAAFTQNLTQSVVIQELGRNVTVPGLQPLIQGRETFLRGQSELNRTRVTLSNLVRSPQNPSANQSICINVTA
ncbi:MAG: CotH kinase family protein, partial [Planctomycetes bacterium]|nr:CotH kinase family protein [Planctomycetota bacterium]